MLKSPLLPAFSTWRVLTTSTEGRSGYTAKNLRFVAKTLLIMHFTAIFVLVGCLTAAAAGHGQNISLRLKGEPLERLFNEIQKQSDYSFVYFKDDLADARKIDVLVKNATVEEVLELTFRNQPLSYTIVDKSIIIKLKPQTADLSPRLSLAPPPPITVRGKIVNEKGEPVIVSVTIKGTTRGTTSNTSGEFEIINTDNNAVLIISGINIETKEVTVNNNTNIVIIVTTKIASEDEVIINAGYYKVEDRKRTGNIARVTSKDIENQPVTSPLLALQGRMAGVNIMPTNGVAGSAVKIQIRGQNSLRTGGVEGNGNLPLYIIDGAPIDSRPLLTVSSNLITDGFDPISAINPANIASIEILKDADATAIYGSRGANGVVLITTRTGTKTGKTNIDVSLYSGVGKITGKMDLLNTEQYLEMRNEAFINDNAIPGSNPADFFNFAPDLKVWDTTRFTDWQKVLLGNTSRINDVQLSISGGSATTSFRLGGSFHKETMVFPGDFGYKRSCAFFNLNHSSTNNKFRAVLSANYGSEKNNLFDDIGVIRSALTLPPDAPELYNENGELNWQNSTWVNPLGALRKTHEVQADNLVANANVSYEVFKGFQLKTNLGFTTFNGVELAKYPTSANNPAQAQFFPGSSRHGTNGRKSWIIEPQATYIKNIGKHTLNIVAGTTLQESIYQSQLLAASDYSSDVLLGNIKAAQYTTFERDDNSQYRYMAVFGRVGYDYNGKYFMNLTGRRDGSSRFGPDNKFANFGAIGAAWVFSNEEWLKKNISFLSFGKLRSSYGSTGNDQIVDYQYYNTYNIVSERYQTSVNLIPTALFNPSLAWEVTRKLEAAIELGLFKNRISIDACWYRNRSSNQLVTYPLTGVTGFMGVFTNLNALIENSGLEILFNSKNIISNNLNWSTSVNITRPRNKLVSFENFHESSYRYLYEIGSPLDIIKLYTLNGVDPVTGYYQFEDADKNGTVNEEDRKYIFNRGRVLYGGINNVFNYKNIELSFLLQFAKQDITNYDVSWPGRQLNLPVAVLNRWQKEGDDGFYQRYSSRIFGAISTPATQFQNSTGAIADASFIRLKTLNLSWSLKNKISAFDDFRLFLQGQNLFTISSYKGLDPETGVVMPPLRIITVGIQIKL